MKIRKNFDEIECHGFVWGGGGYCNTRDYLINEAGETINKENKFARATFALLINGPLLATWNKRGKQIASLSDNNGNTELSTS